MRNIKLTLEYDGSHFFGFQKQPGHRTVHEELERALSSFFDQKMKIASASGRTDTGVHAAGQVVNFKTSSVRSLWQIQKGLNALLPDPVAVTKVEEVPPEFLLACICFFMGIYSHAVCSMSSSIVSQEMPANRPQCEHEPQ